jgi:Bacterial Ig-like domain
MTHLIKHYLKRIFHTKATPHLPKHSKFAPVTRTILLLLLITLGAFILGPGCANVVAPTGGPRDSLPPILLRAAPADSTKNFQAKKIVLNFDEYVNVNDPIQYVIFSPTPKRLPTVEYRLRTVTVTIKDTLEPNTTYSIDFGNSITDINENNILRNFIYVFSTGNTIDNGILHGNVILAETGKPDSTLIAVLHTSGDDSAIVKEKPRYVAKVDSKGSFTFHFLPRKTFYLYVMKDEGHTYQYTSPKQLFAFASKPVSIGDSSNAEQLYAYLERDTSKPRPVASKTTEKPKTTTGTKKLAYQVLNDNGNQGLLDSFKMSFSGRLKTFDTTKFQFTDDTYKPVPRGQLMLDSTGRLLSFYQKWNPGAKYAVILEPGFATDSLDAGIAKNDTLKFSAKKEEDYGSLRLKFRNIDLSKHLVLEFVQGDNIKIAVPLTTDQFYQRLFIPGDYDMRILFDDNNNGVYDPGDFFGSHKQPEHVQFINRRITVKGNWDNEIEISL